MFFRDLILLPADHSGDIEGVRYFEVLDLYTRLFDLIGFPLSVFNLNNERLKWAEEAVTICEMRGCERRAAWIKVFDIGWVNLHNGNIEKAREVIADNLRLAEEKGYPEVEAIALYNRGRMFRDVGKDYERASSDLGKALSKWPDDPKYNIWKAQTMSSLGLVTYQMGDFPLALKRLEESLNIRQELGFRNLIVEGRSDLALALAALGKIPEALRLSDSAINIGLSIEPPSCSSGYSLMRRGQIEKDFLRKKDKAREYLEKANATYRALGAQLMVMLVMELLEDL